MNSALRTFGALLIGLASFALTVLLVLGFERLTDVNLFSMMVWVVVPAGAFAIGLLAASGFYLGAVKLNARPTRFIAWSLLLIGALVQLALYGGQYWLATTPEGQPVRSLVGFGTYVAFVLTEARYGLHVHGRSLGDGVRVGALGYAIAAVQFIGLIAGSLGVYAILADKPYCDACRRFARMVGKKMIGLSRAEIGSSVERLRSHAPLSDEYFQALQSLPPGPDGALELEVFACPACAQQAVVERTMYAKDGKWSYLIDGPANRTVWGHPGSPVLDRLDAAQRGSEGAVG
jgi:hypothetical protein